MKKHKVCYIYIKNIRYKNEIILHLPGDNCNTFIININIFYRNEKKYVLSIIIGSPNLFLLGSLIAYFFIAPLALKFFLSFEAVNFGASNLQLQLETRISEYLKLIINLIMGFGIAFQLPLILLLLLKFKIISVKFLAQKRRYWIVIIFIISAILTPPDVVSQVLLALPMILFFEIVILIAKRWDTSAK